MDYLRCSKCKTPMSPPPGSRGPTCAIDGCDGLPERYTPSDGPNFADIQREHDAADVSLRLVFGDEYAMLPTTSQMMHVRQDFIAANREDGCTASAYRDRIGKGNLDSYARCLRAGKAY